MLDYAVEIGVAGSETSCEPISAALDNFLAVGENLKLSSCAVLRGGFDAEAFFDEGHETRDLSFVALSGGAVNDFDFHF